MIGVKLLLVVVVVVVVFRHNIVTHGAAFYFTMQAHSLNTYAQLPLSHLNQFPKCTTNNDSRTFIYAL